MSTDHVAHTAHPRFFRAACEATAGCLWDQEGICMPITDGLIMSWVSFSPSFGVFSLVEIENS